MSELNKAEKEYLSNWAKCHDGEFPVTDNLILRILKECESKDSELESARKDYDELLDEINEEYSKSAALKRIIEEREVELTSAKDEIDRLVSRCDTYYAKLEEQQKEIELKRETI